MTSTLSFLPLPHLTIVQTRSDFKWLSGVCYICLRFRQENNLQNTETVTQKMDPNQNQQNSSHQVDNLELLRGLREQRRSNEDQVQARIDAMSKENPQMRLSPREQALMRECNNESFWQRSAPLSLLMGTAVTIAARTGKIKGTRVFPKSLGAAMIGYFAGKISYMPICRDKFLTQEPHGDMAKGT